MNGTPISVAMATYNGSKYIADQLDSILAQSRIPDEIVIVDDKSSDSTCEIIESYQSVHPQIKLLKNSRNQGINKSFEKALFNSNGALTFISDQDDVWAANKIEVMLRSWNGEPIIYSDAKVVDSKLNTIFESEFNYHGEPPISERQPWMFLFGNCVIGHNMAVTQELISNATPFPTSMVYDNWLALVACCSSDICLVKEPLCLHRIHDSNAMNNPKALNKHQMKHPSKKKRFSQKRDDAKHFVERLIQIRMDDLEFNNFIKQYLNHLNKYENTLINIPFLRLCLRNRDKLWRHTRGWRRIKSARNLAIGDRGTWLAF